MPVFGTLLCMHACTSFNLSCLPKLPPAHLAWSSHGPLQDCPRAAASVMLSGRQLRGPHRADGRGRRGSGHASRDAFGAACWRRARPANGRTTCAGCPMPLVGRCDCLPVLPVGRSLRLAGISTAAVYSPKAPLCTGPPCCST